MLNRGVFPVELAAANQPICNADISTSATIRGSIEHWARQQPEAIAIKFKRQSLSYCELNQRANQLANYLLRLGVGAEVRVAVCLKPSLEIGITLLAIFKAGGACVPLDPTYPRDRLAAILEDNQPQVILAQTDLLPNLPATAAPVFCCDRDWQTIEHFSPSNPNIDIDLDRTAYIIYTSGTTGRPKGVMASYGNLSHYIFAAQERFGFNRSTMMPAIARYTFSITFFELLSPLVAGGTLTILERESILDFRQLCQTLEQVTAIHASPNLLKKLLSYIEDSGINPARFNRLQHASTGGDLVPPDVLEAMKRVFLQAEIYVIYGCSEISCMGCAHLVPRQQAVTKTLVGQPFDRVAVRLHDPEGNLVPIGMIGEVCISGAGTTKGYLDRLELTAEKFININGQRFYRTGDRGRLDADGNLEILGRADLQIKLNGIRIEPGEIEAVLRQFPGVRETVVVKRELSSGEPGIVAYLVLHPTHPPQIAEIRRYLQGQLPDYMIPAAFVVLEALPLNLNQKLDRQALPAPIFDSGDRYAAPTNDLELQLTKIWQQLLNIQPIGIKDNFFDLGGNSLIAMSLAAAIEKNWGKHLPLAILFAKPTIAELADALAQAEWSPSWSSLVPIQTQGSKPPLFFIHAIGGNVLEYSELARCLGKDRPIYGLQSVGLDGQQEPLHRVEDMASHYINEIRTIQPQGPYFLLGYSFGSIIAFEMAQQLSAQGEEIGLLAACDQDSPNTPKKRRSLAGFAKLHISNIGKIRSPQEKLKYLRDRLLYKLTNFDYKKYLRRQLSKTEVSAPDFLLKLLDTNIQAHCQYRAKVYPGSLALLRCEFQGIEHYFNPDLGWGELAKQGVKIHYIPGHHFDLLRPPMVGILAQELKQYLV